ncbi:CaiB/BaiF CoA transferase family protein [Hyphomonas chukchiensis]|nr:CoA transferase [Hyphomonas chukchiensis]
MDNDRLSARKKIRSDKMSSNTYPLSGIVVIEIGGSLAAPFAGQILGDLGAEVIKVERAQGDDARKWGPPYTAFPSANRNKKSVVLDLRKNSDRESLRRLVSERADVVLQNLRPGHLDEIGMGAEYFRDLKPGLVFCNLGAFGKDGPFARRPGYDPLMQAFAGIMSVVGEEGRPPVRVGPSIVDLGTGMWAVIGILCALMRKRETGVGATVDVSLLETAITWMMGYVSRYSATGEVAKPMGTGQAGIAPYQAYAASDGRYLIVAAGNDSLFQKLCGVLGQSQWATDARFVSNGDRFANRQELNDLIATEIKKETMEHWLTAIDAVGVPCAPVNNVKEMLESEQTKALDIIRTIPGGGEIEHVMLPLSFDGTRPGGRTGPPTLGQHTSEVLAEPTKVG